MRIYSLIVILSLYSAGFENTVHWCIMSETEAQQELGKNLKCSLLFPIREHIYQ